MRKELAGLVNEFAQNTTLHGFGNLFKKRETPNPFKWKNGMFLLAILACVSYLSFNLYSLAQDYLRYPVTTSVVREMRHAIALPAITFCVHGVRLHLEHIAIVLLGLEC